MPNPTAAQMTVLQNQKRREGICSLIQYLCIENRNKGTCKLPSGSTSPLPQITDRDHSSCIANLYAAV